MTGGMIGAQSIPTAVFNGYACAAVDRGKTHIDFAGLPVSETRQVPTQHQSFTRRPLGDAPDDEARTVDILLKQAAA